MLNLPKIIRSKLMIVALGFVIIEIATAAVPEVKKVSPGKNKKGLIKMLYCLQTQMLPRLNILKRMSGRFW